MSFEENLTELAEKGLLISENCKKELDSAKLKITEH